MSRRTLVLWCAPDPSARQHGLTTAADRDRAGRFRLPVDADRRLTARVLARRAAAHHLGRDPGEVHLGAAPEGRPVLLDAHGRPLDAHLSITHAGRFVGVAVADHPVGIDVQDVAALAPVLTSDLVWTTRELHDLAALDAEQALLTAATWWTAKEAVLKSLGRGLLEPAELLEIRRPPVPWRSLDVGPSHAAAIASAGPSALLATEQHLTRIDAPIPT